MNKKKPTHTNTKRKTVLTKTVAHNNTTFCAHTSECQKKYLLSLTPCSHIHTH